DMISSEIVAQFPRQFIQRNRRSVPAQVHLGAERSGARPGASAGSAAPTGLGPDAHPEPKISSAARTTRRCYVANRAMTASSGGEAHDWRGAWARREPALRMI